MAASNLQCEEHGKTFDFYCKRHDAPLCLSCATSHHRSCQDIIPLVDAAKNVKQSTALTNLQETISVGLKNIQTIIQNTTTKNLDEDEKKIKEAIREVRSKIDHQLDKMEQNLILELNSKLKSYKSRQNQVLKRIKESETRIQKIKDQTTEMNNLESDVHIFIKICKMDREVHECLNSTMTQNVIEKYNVNVEFHPVLISILNVVKTFGKINVEVTKTNVQLSQPMIVQAQKHLHPVTKSVREIEVNLKQTFTIKEESNTLFITGCAILPNGELLIADSFSKKQLMQYNPNGTHVRDIAVSSNPYDITVIDSDRVAVSYNESCYIEIINIQNITVEKEVNLDNITRGVSYQGRKLFVVVSGRGIVVIDVSGKIVNTINIDVNTVWYVASTTDMIYYSDYMADTVICSTMSGKQIWKFKDDSLQGPFGLTVDNNQNVIVVGCDNNNVTVISRDGQTSKTLLSESDGLYLPRALDINKNTGNIFVCNQHHRKAFLFKFSN